MSVKVILINCNSIKHKPHPILNNTKCIVQWLLLFTCKNLTLVSTIFKFSSSLSLSYFCSGPFKENSEQLVYHPRHFSEYSHDPSCLTLDIVPQLKLSGGKTEKAYVL